VISTLAPTLGPTIGGWITDSFSWRWLFFINVAPGVTVTVALVVLGPIDRAEPRLLAKIDWLHAASLTAFLGGLQFVLEEGPRRQWLQDRTVAVVAWTAAVACAVFVERCIFSKNPLVRIAPFRRQGFIAASLLSFAIGFGLYTSVYLTPVYLAQVRGYSSLAIGSTVSVTGLFMTLSAAPAAWLVTRFDQRLVMAGGLGLFVISFLMMSDIGADWGFWELFWPQAVRGVAVLFTMVPAVGLALSGLPAGELRDASGLTNLMRNLGGAVGIALVNTALLNFFGLHAAALARSAGGVRGGALTALGGLAQFFGLGGYDPERSRIMAAATFGQSVSVQALALAFGDVFRLCAWVFAACFLVAPFCRPGPMTEAKRHDPAQECD
jgi:DHA2 family multidrug resistance protein